MAASHQQASTTANHKAKEITPASCCTHYFCCLILLSLGPLFLIGIIVIFGAERCYFELFTNSVSVENSTANANVSVADWSIGLVATSPVTGCKISLYTIKSRLLRGQEVISESSPSLGFFGEFSNSSRPDWTVTTLGFDKVVTPGVIGDVVWDVRLEIVARMKTDRARFGNGDSISSKDFNVNDFFVVVCRNIPVKFTADPKGNMMGSLLGNMKRCDYTTVYNADPSNNNWNFD